jgi:myb proto-oncogene protein
VAAQNGYEKPFFSAEFLSVMQEMIRTEVRTYMSGIEQNGLCNLQTEAVRNAVVKRIGISKIE